MEDATLVDRLMVLLLSIGDMDADQIATAYDVTEEAMKTIRADYDAGRTVTAVWAEYFRSL